MIDCFSHFFIGLLLICCTFCVTANIGRPPPCTGLFTTDPDDCTKYYKCAGTQPIRMSCPSGSIWNTHINACVFQQSAQCERKTKSNARPETPSNLSKSANTKCNTQKKSICYGECKFPSYEKELPHISLCFFFVK